MPSNGRMDDYIELSSGRKFNFKTPWDWDLDEIAHSLSNQCRYTGHGKQFYSVAEHSVMCALLAEETGFCDPFEALMHDAHESVLGDMAAPWKVHIPGYIEQEEKLEVDMRDAYGLPLQMTLGCKRVDYLALFLEARYLMRSRGEGWEDPMHMRPLAYSMAEGGWHLNYLQPADAKNTFIRAFRELETVPVAV